MPTRIIGYKDGMKSGDWMLRVNTRGYRELVLVELSPETAKWLCDAPETNIGIAWVEAATLKEFYVLQGNVADAVEAFCRWCEPAESEDVAGVANYQAALRAAKRLKASLWAQIDADRAAMGITEEPRPEPADRERYEQFREAVKRVAAFHTRLEVTCDLTTSGILLELRALGEKFSECYAMARIDWDFPEPWIERRVDILARAIGRKALR